MQPLDVEAAFAETPLFAGLSAAVRQRLRALADFGAWSRGHRFVDQGARAERVLLPISGELCYRLDGVVSGLVDQPLLIGLLGDADDRPRGAAIEAYTDVEAFTFSADTFEALIAEGGEFTRAVLDQLRATLRQRRSAERVARAAFDEHCGDPNARLLAGPYRAVPFDATLLVLAGASPAPLPEGLLPLPGAGDRVVACALPYEALYSLQTGPVRTVRFTELVPLVPCLDLQGRAALFCPELYCDGAMGVLLGRELLGLPRRAARVRVQPSRLFVESKERLICAARWGRAHPIEARALQAHLDRAFGAGHWAGASAALGRGQGRLPILCRRQIARDSQQLRVDSLLEVPVDVQLFGTPRWMEDPQLDAAWAHGDRVEAAVQLRVGLTLHAPVIKRDYRLTSRRA